MLPCARFPSPSYTRNGASNPALKDWGIRVWFSVISRSHPDFHTALLTHLVTHDTLHKAYKYKMRQLSEEGSSYVDFYPGAKPETSHSHSGVRAFLARGVLLFF